MSGMTETIVEYVIERKIKLSGMWIQWCETDLAGMYDDLECIRSHDDEEYRLKRITTVITSEILT